MPIALRLTLIENLRRLTEEIVEGRAARLEADRLADVLLGQGGRPADPEAFTRLGDEVLTSAYAVQLVQRLRDQDPNTTPALAWLEQRLAAAGTPAEELVRAEYQRQGAANVTVRNIITSLRVMETFDWREFFESVSLVDRILRAESEFGAMDFATRDRYRKAVEDLARGSGRSEMEVARAALGLARAHAPDGRPGYYLISRGRRGSRRPSAIASGSVSSSCRAYVASATWSYLGSIAIVTRLVPLLAPPLHRGAGDRHRPAGGAGGPRLLPRLRRGDRAHEPRGAGSVSPARLAAARARGRRAAHLKTLVAVPTLLTGEAQIAEQIAGSGSTTWPTPRGPSPFAILSDWTDADAAERGPETSGCSPPPQAGIDELNRQHGPAGRWRATIPPPSPAARVERGRGPVDRLGAKAREAPRAEPAAARRGGHDLRRHRPRAPAAAGRRAVRHHPGRRHSAPRGARRLGSSARSRIP